MTAPDLDAWLPEPTVRTYREREAAASREALWRRGGERALLCREARVKPVDRSSAVGLRALWNVIGRFEPLVAAEPLTVAARRGGGRRAGGRPPGRRGGG